MLANGSQLPLALAVPCREVLASSAPHLGDLWAAALRRGRARKKNIRINLFVVVGVIRLIIVAVIIANTIIIIIIRIRHPLPWLKYSTVHPRCLTLGLC